MEKIVVEKTDVRLDVYLSDKLDYSRSNISKRIKEGKILVNEKKVKNGYILKENDIITLDLTSEESNIIPEDIKLDIYYEDEDIIVVNKPSGMVVHPAAGNKSGTLVNALINHTKNLSDVNGEVRPGIVHRIDKDTSGLLLVSKTNKAHNVLAALFKKHKIKRKYIALVSGVIKHDKGRIEAPIGRSNTDRKKFMVTDKNAKEAITNFKVLERYKDATLLELVLETGRTHQIRVHLSYINHPIINDKVYSKKIINDYGQMLHAYYLGFNHPITGRFMEFEAPLEKEFLEILEMFKNS